MNNNELKTETKKKTNSAEKKGRAVLYITSVVAVILVSGIILGISLAWPTKHSQDDTREVSALSDGEKASDSDLKITVEEYIASSDANPAENIGDVDRKLVAGDFAGMYVDSRDGWSYEFDYCPSDAYDGTFRSAFENVLSGESTGDEAVFSGTWKLENGEIKLYSGDVYMDSLLACGEYIIDSKALFVGNVSRDDETIQSKFALKDVSSGDVRILNLYSDGKVIYEITTVDEAVTSSDGIAGESKLQLVAGTYTKTDDIVTVTIEGTSVQYQIVDGGLAAWVYTKKID